MKQALFSLMFLVFVLCNIQIRQASAENPSVPTHANHFSVNDGDEGIRLGNAD